MEIIQTPKHVTRNPQPDKALLIDSILLKEREQRGIQGKMTGHLHMADIAELGGLFIADFLPFRAARRKGATGWILSIIAPVQF